MKELFTYQSEMSTEILAIANKTNCMYKTKLCVSKRALRYNGCIEFNNLPSELKYSTVHVLPFEQLHRNKFCSQTGS